MFSIYDGRSSFYQWDLDRKLIVNDSTIKQVHYCNKTSDCSLVCDVYEENGKLIADVPNILLQTDWKINVYGYDSNYTKYSACFDVVKRSKPADYIYTETECYTVENAVDEAIKEAQRLGKLDSNAFYVTISYDEETDTYSANYTDLEIFNAYRNGKAVFCTYRGHIYAATQISPGSNYFSAKLPYYTEIISIQSGKVRIYKEEVEQIFNAGSANPQSGVAVQQAINKVQRELNDKVTFIEFFISEDVQAEDGSSVYYSDYTIEEFHEALNEYSLVYGIFYDGGIEHAHPLVFVGSELSFNQEIYPCTINGELYWSTQRSLSNEIYNNLSEIKQQIAELEDKSGFKVIAETTLTEDAAEIAWTKADDGTPLSNYKEFFIHWMGQFTTTTTDKDAFMCRGNGGSLYFAYYFFKKTANANRGGWFHIEEIYREKGGMNLYKTTFPNDTLYNYSTNNSFQAQGLSGNNCALHSDLTCAVKQDSAIEWIGFGNPSSAKSTFKAGTKAILLGRAR